MPEVRAQYTVKPIVLKVLRGTTIENIQIKWYKIKVCDC